MSTSTSKSKKNSTFTMHVISHTHWDREWYRPFQHFRMRLVDLVDQLIKTMQEDPEYRCFHLDGQTIVLEDYLQIRPENEAVLRQLVREGRILVGPWYNQPDEFLVSAEAMVRNLALGRRMGDDWGGWMRIGYVPDCFGHISQFPQIMRGFGIDNAVLFRGVNTDQVDSEFTWRGADGSEVLCVKMPDDNAYSNFFYRLRETLSAVKESGARSQKSEGDRKGETFFDRPGVWEAFGLPVNGERSTVNGTAGTVIEGLSLEEFFQKTREEIAALVEDCVRERPTTGHLLFMDGVDHIFANPMVPAIIKDANGNLDLGTLVHDTLPNFVEAVKAGSPDLQTYEGELRISNRRGKLGALLAGVMSSRVHLKQANHEIQTLLEKWAEPWSTIAWTLGKEYPQSYIDLAWKYLLQNHPHDSICGCSVDQVHKDMVYRFDQARLIAKPVADRSLLYVTERIGTDRSQESEVRSQKEPDELTTQNAQRSTSNEGPDNPHSELRTSHSLALVVFNPLSWERTEVVEAEVNFPGEWHFQGVQVVDSDGNEVPFQVLEVGGGGTFYQEWYDIPIYKGTHRRRIAFLAENVPSVGYKTYYVRALDHPYRTPGSMMFDPVSAGNKHVSVSPDENGALYIGGHAEGMPCIFHGMIFEDGGDFGDGWNYRRPQMDTMVLSAGNQAQVSVIADGPVRTTFKVDVTMKVPASMHTNALERSKDTVDLPITSYVTLNKGSQRVDIITEVDNTARDHRLRVIFPSAGGSGYSNAESLYDVVTRPVHIPDCRDWKEPMPSTHPQKSFVDVSDGSVGVTIINEGLPEFEVKPDAERTIALTLLRGVIGGVGGPESQEQGELIGKHTFRYAVYPHKGDWQQAQVWREAWAHNVPMRVIQTGIHSGDQPLEQSFMGIESPGVVLSALKKADREDRIVARVFNITESPAESCEISIHGTDKVFQADLNEELASDAPIGDNGASVDVGAKKIVTLIAERK